jgi:amidase
VHLTWRQMSADRPTVIVPIDTVGAFVGPPSLLVTGEAGGPLTGVRLGVKDLIDVAGTVTRAGNPSFGEGRAPASRTALAVQRLVDAGAAVVGRTITDEMAYSLSGTNVHDGTPVNVAAPGRVPGGSSAGSAAAVAAGLVELALGTDTGGSIRVPASYCGIWGWRPTHGAVSVEGVVPLAPSFDTVGLLAADVNVLRAGADALLGTPARVDRSPIARLALVEEIQCVAAPSVAAAVADVARSLQADLSTLRVGVDLDTAIVAFRHHQGFEAWREHGEWITTSSAVFGRGIAERFRAAAQVTSEEFAAAAALRAQVCEAMAAATADGTVLVMPAAAGAAPLLTADSAEQQRVRIATLRLTCLAGLAGLPVVVARWAHLDGLPLGVAFVGAAGSDRELLEFVAQRAADR